MAEEKKEVDQVLEVNQLTKEQVAQEYTGLCTQSGDLQYKIECMKGDLQVLNDRMLQLNQANMALIAREQQEKQAEANKIAQAAMKRTRKAEKKALATIPSTESN